MAYPAIKDIVSQKGAHYTADLRPVDNSSGKGYLNNSCTLMVVRIDSWQESFPMPYHFGVIVDTDRQKILDFPVVGDVLAGPEKITIPAGSAWYSRLANPYQETRGGQPSIYFEARYTPIDACVKQIIVSEAGLGVQRNASALTPSENLSPDRYVVVGDTIFPNDGVSPNGYG